MKVPDSLCDILDEQMREVLVVRGDDGHGEVVVRRRAWRYLLRLPNRLSTPSRCPGKSRSTIVRK